LEISIQTVKPQRNFSGIYHERQQADLHPVCYGNSLERNKRQMKIFALDPLDLPIFYNLFPESLLHDVPADAFLVGCADGEPLQPAGVLIAHAAQRSLIVDWLYVDEAYRRRGGASQMMQMLLDCAFEVEEIEDVTLTFSQKHTGMGAFLRAMQFGVVFMEGCKGYETTLSKFRYLPEEKAISVMLEPFSRRLQACSIRRLLTKSAKPIFILSLKMWEI
jgi:GNAT superfamily N-acetyltransferase